MKLELWVALFAFGLALPSAAAAFDGPEVPSEALAEVPEAVREEWSRRAERVEQMTREIEAARSSTALMDSVDAVDAARRDLRVALTEASNLRDMARCQLQLSRLAGVQARIDLQTAKLARRNGRGELRDARDGEGRSEVREARWRLADAHDELWAARAELAFVEESSARVERAADHQLAVAAEVIGVARQALNEMRPVTSGVGGRRVTASELALLEARRDLAAAELEHDRAKAALASGARLRLRPFLAALEVARSAEDAARHALLHDD